MEFVSFPWIVKLLLILITFGSILTVKDNVKHLGGGIKGWLGAVLILIFFVILTVAGLVGFSPLEKFKSFFGPPPQPQVIDPREELSKRGILWTDEAFHKALVDKDVWAVEKFFQAGMRMDAGNIDFNEFKFFVTSTYFDEKIANLIIEYKTVNSIKCPTPPNTHWTDFSFYTKYANSSPPKLEFVRRVCNIKDVLARFDRGLAKLSDEATQYQKNEDDAKKLLNSIHRSPENQRMYDASRAASEAVQKRQIEENGLLLIDPRQQLPGWQAARKILSGD